MKEYQPGAWSVMSGLLVTQILVSSPYLTLTAVFMTPFIRTFGWSHAAVGELAFAAALVGGFVAPAAGWLLDRVDARWTMAAGISLMALLYCFAARCSSFGAMALVWALLGVGSQLAIIPIMVVSINWFGGRRGFAGGVIMFGRGLGMALSPLVLTTLIIHYGWRSAIGWMTAPALLVALPYVLWVMRTRPAATQARGTAAEVATLPGLELKAALSSTPFLLVLAAEFLFTSGFSASLTHSITYMIGLGFRPQRAALIYSAQTMGTALCTVPLGLLADRVGTRRVLALALMAVAIGNGALAGFSNLYLQPFMIPLYIVGWGVPCGTIFALLPVLLAESIGLRRLGTAVGVMGFTTAIGMATGPIWAGRIFDLNGSYVPALLIASGAILLGAGFVQNVRPAPGHDQLPLPRVQAVSATA
ncbi:MAG TPA: MFS transporter [Candidatus Binataceae bacterium]|nr:MFS transporter [Candidatus Binataceae bacterium]